MQNEEKITHVLELIGLNKNEIIVFLDLIRSGKSSVIDISKRTGIHRSNTYDVLEKLHEKGIVDEIVENEKKIYYPIDPKDLLHYLKQKEIQLKEIIPDLEQIQNKINETRKVYISEGLNSVKNIISHLLDGNEEILIYGTPKEVVDILGGFVNDFHKERIHKKIPMKHIFGIDSIKRVKELNEMPLTEVRYLPNAYSSTISTNICKNKVVLILWDAPLSAIVIESQTVADSYKKKFDILWDAALTISNTEVKIEALKSDTALV